MATRARITNAYFIQPENENQENTRSLTLPKRVWAEVPRTTSLQEHAPPRMQWHCSLWVRPPILLCTHQTTHRFIGGQCTPHTLQRDRHSPGSRPTLHFHTCAFLCPRHPAQTLPPETRHLWRGVNIMRSGIRTEGKNWQGRWSPSFIWGLVV